MNRLFFALWPTDPVRAACAEAARDLKIRMQPSGRPSAAERYHLTLLFLGDYVSAAQQEAALRAAAGVRSAPFQLKLDHAGSFRNPKDIPWWLGAHESPAALRTLYERLRDAMNQSGVSLERMRLTPHLTILRDRKLALPVTAIRPIVWPVEEFVLIRSRLDQKPAHYELLGRWPLIEGPQPQSAQLSLWG